MRIMGLNQSMRIMDIMTLLHHCFEVAVPKLLLFLEILRRFMGKRFPNLTARIGGAKTQRESIIVILVLIMVKLIGMVDKIRLAD